MTTIGPKILSLGLLCLIACGPFDKQEGRVPRAYRDNRLSRVFVDNTLFAHYLIDANSECCFFVAGTMPLSPIERVDCAALARNLPAAAEFIKWLPQAESQSKPDSTPAGQ